MVSICYIAGVQETSKILEDPLQQVSCLSFPELWVLSVSVKCYARKTLWEVRYMISNIIVLATNIGVSLLQEKCVLARSSSRVVTEYR